MLNGYLLEYVDSLDADNYRVRLKDNLDYSSNQAYLDGDYWSVAWFKDFWFHFFRARLKSSTVRIEPHSRVLDCCCGQGYLGRFIEEEFAAHAVYCDLSERQLHALLEHRGHDTAHRVCAANLLQLPFASESFDWVLGNSFLHHIPDIPTVLSEFYRVTRKGGGVVLFHEPSTNAVFWDSFPLSLLKDTTPTAAQVGFTDLWLFTPEDLLRLAREAGFTDVKVYGAGILSAILLNWYLLLALKLNWRSHLGVYPVYALRAWLNRIDLSWQASGKRRSSPSLMVVAHR